MKISLPIEIDDAMLETAMVRALDKFPDFVMVTRCKDCKWWNEIGCAIRIVDESDKPNEYDFCSYGERIENEI